MQQAHSVSQGRDMREHVPAFELHNIRDQDRQRELMDSYALSAHVDRFSESFSVADAATVDAAWGIGTRKGAGLVSLSTTRPSGGRDSELAYEQWQALSAARSARATVANAMMVDPDRARLAGLRRSVGFAARCHAVSERGMRSDVCKMLTLTYRSGGDWRPEHVRNVLHTMRKWCIRHRINFRYVWVAELQKRGVIHYHIAFWMPYHMQNAMPMPDAAGWWPHGSTRIETAKGAVGYLMKYLSKGLTNQVGGWRLPKGARMHGNGGLEHSLKRAQRWIRYPSFVKCNADVNDNWTRAQRVSLKRLGGWYQWPGDGMGPPRHWPSEYRRVLVGGAAAMQRVHEHPRAIEAAGAFSWLRAE